MLKKNIQIILIFFVFYFVWSVVIPFIFKINIENIETAINKFSNCRIELGSVRLKTASIIREGKLLLTDKVENLSYTGVKRISLKNLDTIPMDKNIRNVKQENETVNFLYSGSTKELMNILSSLSFSDITISDSDLEDVFMHYYVKE